VSRSDQPQAAGKIVGDLLDAADAAAEIVARGKDAWQQDRLLRLAGEAVISRIGDAAAKLPKQVQAAMPAVPWDDIRANRILVAHIYHRIDYEILWETLARDVPSLASEIEAWRSAQITPSPEPEAEHDA
jgi:uncharacterized protein with HEPN domain